VSSLVASAPLAGKILLTGGQYLSVFPVLKSAVVAGTVVITATTSANVPVVGQQGARELLSVQAYGLYAGGDSVLATAEPASGYEAVGADRQPVQLIGVLGSNLVP
jgi:hypothetical protein